MHKQTMCPHKFSYKAVSLWKTQSKDRSEAEERLQVLLEGR